MKIYKLATWILIVISLWLISALCIWEMTDSFEIRGQIGDMFGAVNSLFAGLAFVGLIYTIVIQKNEIKEQNERIIISQKLTYLSTLLNIYSADEEKYLNTNKKKSEIAKEKKENTLQEIERMFNE